METAILVAASILGYVALTGILKFILISKVIKEIKLIVKHGDTD